LNGQTLNAASISASLGLPARLIRRSVDLLLFNEGKRYGVEVKRADAPGMTKSIAIAMEDLKLDGVTIVAPVPHAYDVAEHV